jgi:hypothetical protein
VIGYQNKVGGDDKGVPEFYFKNGDFRNKKGARKAPKKEEKSELI